MTLYWKFLIKQRNMLKLNKPYRYNRNEWQHVSTILIPYVRANGGQKGWEKADNTTKDIKNSISSRYYFFVINLQFIHLQFSFYCYLLLLQYY